MGSEPGTSEGKIHVDEHYPSEADDGPPVDIKRIDNIRSNVKFDQCYEISKHIGDGKFGKVFHVKDKATGLEYAAKFIKIRKEADRADVEREVKILTNLRHPRIAQIYDAFYTTTNEVVLIMEIVRGGELFDRVADETYVLTEQAVAMIICQLCEAISYIHQQNIIHLDIKPENIMCVSQTGNRIKLIDFGLARYYDGTQELKYMAGTPEFAAPEVIKYENLDKHTDMWSIGVVAYILLSGCSPFLGDNLGETYCNVEKGEWEFVEEFDSRTPESKDFISKLLVYDQKKRMLPAECLAHPWIAQHKAKAMVDANLEKPAEGPRIDNRQMRGYNAKRKFRRMVIYVKFLIEMNRLRSCLRDRKSETGQKFFDPLLKMAEEKERKVAAVVGNVSTKPLSSKSALGNLVTATLEKKRVSVPAVGVEEAISPKKDVESTKTADKEVIKTITKQVVDPVTGEVKTIKRKIVKKIAVDGEKKPSVKRKEGETEKKDDIPAAETPKKMKNIVLGDVEQSPIPSPDLLKKKKVSVTSEFVPTPPPPQETPKKKSVVLVEQPLKAAEIKPNIFLETVKKRRSLPADLPSSVAADTKTETIQPKKKSLVTELPSIQVANEPITEKKKKSIADLPSVAVKITGGKSILSSEVNSLSKKKSIVAIEISPSVKSEENKVNGVKILKERKSLATTPETTQSPLASTQSIDNLTLPRVEKKTQKSESSDSTKENRDHKPERQGAIKKKEKMEAGVLNISSTRKSVDSAFSINSGSNNGNDEKVIIKKKTSLKSSGEKDRIMEEMVELKKEEKKGVNLIKARLSKLNGDVPPFTMNIMSVTQKPCTEEKKTATIISMTPEKMTTTTTSTTTSVRKKSSTTEKKVQLQLTDGKTVEQVEKVNNTHNKVKVSQVTTKKEESPELEAPITSVKKKVVKQNTLKSQSEKQRKEEEKTNEGSVLQLSKVLHDKTLNQVAVNEQTTLPSGSAKKVSLTTSSEVSKKIEGKAEVELTRKRASLKKADLILTENTKTTLGSDINGNKTLLQKFQKTEIKITPSTPAPKEPLVNIEPLKDVTSSETKKRTSILSVSKLLSRDNSEERKTVRFAGDVKEPSKSSVGLQKLNSESCLPKKIQSSLKIEEKISKDDGEIKKKKRIFSTAKSEEVYLPKEEFSFENLKSQLLRRVSATDIDTRPAGPKECVPVAKVHSVKDRLRQFEQKKT